MSDRSRESPRLALARYHYEHDEDVDSGRTAYYSYRGRDDQNKDIWSEDGINNIGPPKSPRQAMRGCEYSYICASEPDEAADGNAEREESEPEPSIVIDIPKRIEDYVGFLPVPPIDLDLDSPISPTHPHTLLMVFSVDAFRAYNTNVCTDAALRYFGLIGQDQDQDQSGGSSKGKGKGKDKDKATGSRTSKSATGESVTVSHTVDVLSLEPLRRHPTRPRKTDAWILRYEYDAVKSYHGSGCLDTHCLGYASVEEAMEHHEPKHEGSSETAAAEETGMEQRGRETQDVYSCNTAFSNNLEKSKAKLRNYAVEHPSAWRKVQEQINALDGPEHNVAIQWYEGDKYWDKRALGCGDTEAVPPIDTDEGANIEDESTGQSTATGWQSPKTYEEMFPSIKGIPQETHIGQIIIRSQRRSVVMDVHHTTRFHHPSTVNMLSRGFSSIDPLMRPGPTQAEKEKSRQVAILQTELMLALACAFLTENLTEDEQGQLQEGRDLGNYALFPESKYAAISDRIPGMTRAVMDAMGSRDTEEVTQEGESESRQESAEQGGGQL